MYTVTWEKAPMNPFHGSPICWYGVVGVCTKEGHEIRMCGFFSHQHKTIGLGHTIELFSLMLERKHVSEACQVWLHKYNWVLSQWLDVLYSVYGGISKEMPNMYFSCRETPATERCREGDGCPWMGDCTGHHPQYSWHNIFGQQTAAAQTCRVRQWLVSIQLKLIKCYFCKDICIKFWDFIIEAWVMTKVSTKHRPIFLPHLLS